MKKFWKSTAALLMGAAFAVSGAGCGGDTTGSTSDSLPGGSSAEMPVASGASLAYVDKAIAQFSAAKSVKASLSLEYSLDYDETAEYDESGAGTLSAELILSKSETGLNGKLTYEVGGKADSDTEERTESGELLLIDGNLYNFYEGKYFYVPANPELLLAGIPEGPKMILDMALNELLQMDFSETFTEEDVAALRNQFGLYLDNYGKAEGNEFVVSKTTDIKSELTAMLVLINGINEETTTLETAINTVLGVVQPGLKIADILDEVAALGTMTVAEVVEALDSALSGYGISLQEIYGELVSSEIVASLLASMGMTSDMLPASIADILGMEMGEKTLGQSTVDEIIALIMASMGGGEIPDMGDETAYAEQPAEAITLAALIEQAKAYLAGTTLAGAGIVFPAWDNVAISAASDKVELRFGEDKTLTSYTEELEFGVTGLPVDADNYEFLKGFAVKANLKVENISSETVAISLPEGAVAYFDIEICDAFTPVDAEGNPVEMYVSFALMTMSDDSGVIWSGYDCSIEYGRYSLKAEYVSDLPTEMNWTLTNEAGEAVTVTFVFDWDTMTVDISEFLAVSAGE